MASIRPAGGAKVGRASVLRLLRSRFPTRKMHLSGHCWAPPPPRRAIWASSLTSERVMTRRTCKRTSSNSHRHVPGTCIVRATTPSNKTVQKKHSTGGSAGRGWALSYRGQLQSRARPWTGARTWRTLRCKGCKPMMTLSTMTRQSGETRNRTWRGNRNLVLTTCRSQIPWHG